MAVDDKKTIQLLLDDLHTIMQKESEYRQEYEVGDRFRTIPNQLHELQKYLEEKQCECEEQAEAPSLVTENIGAKLIYIYLYNAQGKKISRWNNMLSPRRLVEYGVNRPIYGDVNHIASFINSKENSQEHAYLTVAVNSYDIIDQASPQQDSCGHNLLRLTDTALKFDRVQLFTHQDSVYRVVDGKFVEFDAST